MVKIPDGWKAIEDLKINDLVVAKDGTYTKVTGVYPQGELELFKITFEDGRTAECCADHLWNVYHSDFDAVQRNGIRKPINGYGKSFKTLDTATIKRRLSSGTNWSKRHYIDLVMPENNSVKNFYIDPYIVGCMIGDGAPNNNSSRFLIPTYSILDRISSKLKPGYKISIWSESKSFIECGIIIDRESKEFKDVSNLLKHKNRYTAEFKKLGLLIKSSSSRFIPEGYMNGSIDQRFELMRGLMDSDGSVATDGKMRYDTSSFRLAMDVQRLVWSLGGIAKVRLYKSKDCYSVLIRVKNPLSIVTKPEGRAERIKDHNQYSKTLKLRINSIEPIGVDKATCIAVDHPEKLFVIKDYIVTHNTLIGLATVAERKKRTVVLLSGYLEKWWGDILGTLDISEDRMYLVQGVKSIDKLIDEYKMFNTLDYDIFIIAGTTFSNFVRDTESGAINYIKAEKFLDMLEFDTLLVDEVHERFFSVYQFCLYCNPSLILAMTATFTSSNEYVKKFQDMMFPKPTRLNFVAINKYINTLAVHYRLNSQMNIKYKNQGMYSHDVYENSTIIKNRNRLLNYVEMIEHYIDTEFLDKDYKKGNKLVIFVASIRFATMLTEYLKNRYKNLEVKRYVDDDEYENVIKPDVRVSTMQSAGTAVDIPGLTVVLNTVLAKSPVRNKQSHGRLREIEDVEVKYIYFYCRDIDKHKEFNRVRTDQLRPYSKTYREAEYIKKI